MAARLGNQLATLLRTPRRLLVLGSAALVTVALILSHNQGYVDFAAASPGLWPSWSDAAPSIMGQGEPLVFSLIVVGNETAYETEVLLKSALMHTSSPIDFHLIADEKSQEFLTNVFELIERPAYDIRVFFYPISIEAMKQRLRRTAVGRPGQERYMEMRSNHQAGTPGMMKLFLHEILPDTVKRSMFVDSDAFFMTDPTFLWKEFNRWGPDVMLAIPSHDERGDEYDGTTKICSCILLLDLEKMRKHRYIDSTLFSPSERARALSPKANLQVYGEPAADDGTYKNLGLGDQTYFMSIKIFRPDLHTELPPSWEVTSCLLYTYDVGMHGSPRMTAEDQIKSQRKTDGTGFDGQLITPGIVHFNCMYANTYLESPFFDDPNDGHHIKWLHAVRYHQYYKWIWLNRGHGDTKMTITTMQDLRFWDEKLAGVIEPAGYPDKAA